MWGTGELFRYFLFPQETVFFGLHSSIPFTKLPIFCFGVVPSIIIIVIKMKSIIEFISLTSLIFRLCLVFIT